MLLYSARRLRIALLPVDGLYLARGLNQLLHLLLLARVQRFGVVRHFDRLPARQSLRDIGGRGRSQEQEQDKKDHVPSF